MKYQLRDYQKKASDAAVMCFKMKSGRNGLLVLPTGAGKSLIIADIAARLEEPLIVFQPNKEILEQNFAKLQTYGIWDCSIYSASGSERDQPHHIRHYRQCHPAYEGLPAFQEHSD